jgi:hypothetical protein
MTILQFTQNPAFDFIFSQWIHMSIPVLTTLALMALLRN